MRDHIPTRPFESLDWYRDATRPGSGGRGVRQRFLDWVRGIGFLSLHVSIYAVGIVSMFVVNLLRSPDDLWVDRSIPIWSLIVVIHAGVVGLVWAIGLLNRDDDEPIRVVSDAHWRHAETWPDGGSAAPTQDGAPAPDAPATSSQHTESDEERSAGQETTREPVPAPPVPTSPEPKWAGWESDTPQRIDPNDPDRASWQEAAAAAWRDRRSSRSAPDGDSTDRP